MKKENLQMKLIEKLVEKKFNYWREEFIKEVKKEINSKPNRDDKICLGNGKRLAITDGGGIRRFEVFKIIESLSIILKDKDKISGDLE